MPKVTVLMAVYNGERYLREAIESVLSQTFADFEFLILNDGSTDSSAAIVRSYSDRRIRLIDNQRNVGLARSLNQGLELAQGTYVARQDADDISDPDRLARQVSFLETHADVALVGTWYQKIDAGGQVIGRRQPPCEHIEICWSLLFFCPFAHTAVMLRKDPVLEQVGFYNAALTYSMDYELWFRIAARMPVANLGEYLLRVRSSPWSMTNTYGEHTGEGQRIRIATITDLLGWDGDNAAHNAVMFGHIKALLFGAPPSLGAQQAELVAREILRLHARFRQAHKLSSRDGRRHLLQLRARLSRQFIVMAHRAFEQGDRSEAQRLLRGAYRLYWPILYTRNYLGLCLRLQARSGFENVVRHLVKRH